MSRHLFGPSTAEALHKRAARAPLQAKLDRMQGEAGELVGAIFRFRQNPTESNRLLLAEEMVAIMFSLQHCEADMSDSCQSVLNRQLSRLATALDREGL